VLNKRPLNDSGCLFCLRDDGGFVGREHIFPEGLGNTEKILPPGIVCDRCNNGPLARADKELVEFPPITLLLAERGISTKAGKAVMSKWGNGRVVFSERGTMEVIGPSKKAVRGMREFDPANGVPGKLELTTGWRLTEGRISRIARAIWKSALEFHYLDSGPVAAFDTLLDDARRAVIEEKVASGWVVVPQECHMNDAVTLEYQLMAPNGTAPAFPVRLSVYGAQFLTDLLRRDTPANRLTPPYPAEVWTFGREVAADA
jgi:hypothetical protein